MPGFEQPFLLLFLLLLPLCYFIYLRVLSKKKKHAILFSNLGLVKSALHQKKRFNRDFVIFLLSMLMIACMIIGFSDPHIPLKQAKEGVNVVLVIDVSGSMRAEDYPPNRLEAAKASAQILLKSLDAKDHAGIVTFESGATTAAYLSPFKDTVIKKLQRISPRDGRTAIGDGLSLGIDMATSIPNKKKVVILLSDGVSNDGVISPAEAIAFAKTNAIQVYTIGLGSQEPVVLGYDFFGRPQYAELDEATLQAIAAETGGVYFKSVDPQTLDEVYQNISEDIERELEETNIKEWFFLLSLALMLLILYLRYGGSRVIQ